MAGQAKARMTNTAANQSAALMKWLGVSIGHDFSRNFSFMNLRYDL